MSNARDTSSVDGYSIAIVGMAGRFPGAKNIDEFWQNIRNGKESITLFSAEELVAAGLDPGLAYHPRYVRAEPVLEEVDRFDASFFGYSPREAEILDPQQRLFLECAWQALEHAGYDPATYQGAIGMYAGAQNSTYLLNNLYTGLGLSTLPEDSFKMQIMQGNDKDFLATRVAYKLNLQGPSLTIQTACSSSLVAIHLACQSLLSFENDIALAGGVAIKVAPYPGYMYQEGGIVSPDGHCRAFDAQGKGTIFGSGLGIVVLKRVEDALTAGDTIWAVIKGSAINNDGSEKVGYTAPGVRGQAKVVAEALALAGVEPSTVQYIETHGTGTVVGDPIEVAALRQVYAAGQYAPRSCVLGSVKTNVGHLDVAAGVTGLIKTVLMLKHAEIPPTLHFQNANPDLRLEESPFYVTTHLKAWERAATPRRAGVSSFGVGGTNAHVILEEAPPLVSRKASPAYPYQILVLSARSESALNQARFRLAEHFQQHPDMALPDVAFTLQAGRRVFSHRAMAVCRDTSEAVHILRGEDPSRLSFASGDATGRPVVFLLPGQGSQQVGMGEELYAHEPVFRAEVQRCCHLLEPLLGLDLRSILYPPAAQREEASEQLKQTWLSQPALFVVEYALARLWQHWGVEPRALLGHSLGEYVAACLAGVFSLEEGLELVVGRGRLMQQVPEGAMLAVPLAPEELAPLLGGEVDLAAVNGPARCVVAGPGAAVKRLSQELEARGIRSWRLATSHAFHSRMMEPILEEFEVLVRRCHLREPQRPYISNVTGRWITGQQATDARYWVEHLRQPVRFWEGMQCLLAGTDQVFLEVGPGRVLSTLVRREVCEQQASREEEVQVYASLPAQEEQRSELASLLTTLGRLWLAGVSINWQQLHTQENRQRVPLPTYPFEHQRYWIEPALQSSRRDSARHGFLKPMYLEKSAEIADWFYVPIWRQEALPPAHPEGASFAGKAFSWLLFSRDAPDEEAADLCAYLAERIRQAGQNVSIVRCGEQFARQQGNNYTINPTRLEDYVALFHNLQAMNQFPQRIVHAWLISPQTFSPEKYGDDADSLNLGFSSLLLTMQALHMVRLTEPLHLWLLSSNMHCVVQETFPSPEKASALGLCKVLSQENPFFTWSSVDVLWSAVEEIQVAECSDLLFSEFAAKAINQVIAYRKGQRLVQVYEPGPLSAQQGSTKGLCLRTGGVYLITGGLGELGLTIAEYLARRFQAKLILLGHSHFPEKRQWKRWLDTHNEEDPCSQKIRRFLALEKLGSRVLPVQADITDLSQTRQAIERAKKRFGSLHGIIHAAGKKGTCAFTELDVDTAQTFFLPKVRGAYVLAELLRDQQIDFCVVLSSLASVLGGVGFAAYAAANQALDTFVQRQQLIQPGRWITVNWESWRLSEQREEDPGALSPTLARLALSPEEGCEALLRILTSGYQPQIVISTGNLGRRLDYWFARPGVPEVEQRLITGDTSSQAPLISHYTRPVSAGAFIAPATAIEQTLADIWQDMLGIDKVGLHDNFFDLGGHSFMLGQMHERIQEKLLLDVPPTRLFKYSTIHTLAEHISQLQPVNSIPEGDKSQRIQQLPSVQDQQKAEEERSLSKPDRQAGIAVVGMSGRFPGAKNVEEFWQNLCNGIEALSFFSEEEMCQAGVPPNVWSNPRYVRAGFVLDDVELFDAAFFGLSARDALLLDPQQRLFLECAWEALEHAGYVPDTYAGRIGVFAGQSTSTYLLSHLYANRSLPASADLFQLIMHNGADFLTTRASYKLNLRGPSVGVQTACSTSLVAVHLACEQLLHKQCDMALAGGVSIRLPQKAGYLYQEDSLVSPDGHCRAFDADARGTVFGSGIGIVVLKRLEDALSAGDTIYAVIKGTAMNNDGSLKIGYTAPSVDGQVEVVTKALQMADVSPETITYIEAHGTGTVLGDPVEVIALSQVLGSGPGRPPCALGSVKTNVGHLDAASGVTGMIKAALALHHKLLPATLHFSQPNPQIPFEQSPFYVNTTLVPWNIDGMPRRAGVHSLGIGGTNAHAVLEEALPLLPSSGSRPWQLLLLSGRTASSLESATANLETYLRRNPQVDLADVAYTLQVGRKAFEFRRVIPCSTVDDAVTAIETRNKGRCYTSLYKGQEPGIIFLLPGQGSQRVGMGEELYTHEPVFRTEVQRCCRLLEPLLGLDLLSILYAPARQREEAEEQLKQTWLSQPALFVVEYALARLWQHWGVQPQALLGHSLGEYVAACLAGVFSLEEGLELVVGRARLMQQVPEGAMLAVPVGQEEVLALLGGGVELAAVNGPSRCVVAGAVEEIERLSRQLAAAGIGSWRLATSHAFHSRMVEPILGEFEALVRRCHLREPQRPYISNVTGSWITGQQATDARYWVEHLRQPVRFWEGVQCVLEGREPLFVEVGPGRTLSGLVRRGIRERGGSEGEGRVYASLPGSEEQSSELACLLTTLGHLWLAGARIDWEHFYAHERRRRIALPTYPFERKQYWVDTPISSDYQDQTARMEKTTLHPVVTQPALSQEASPVPMTEKDLKGIRTLMAGQATNSSELRSRKTRLLPKLQQMFARLFGVEVSTLDHQATFLDMGAESLFLVQASQALRDEFGAAIPFRKMMNELSTLEALATYLDQTLPAEVLAQPEESGNSGQEASSLHAKAVPSSLAHLAPGGKENALSISPQALFSSINGHQQALASERTPLEQLMAQQLQTFSQLVTQQLALLAPQDSRASSSANGYASQLALSQSPSEASPSAFSDQKQAAATANGHQERAFVPYQPARIASAPGLTVQQQQYLIELITRLRQRTQESQRLTQRYRPFLADNRASAGFHMLWKEIVYPLIADRSSGAKIYDVDDNEYIDLAMGFGVHLFGHAPAFITQALEGQLHTGIQLGPQALLAGKVAEAICHITGVERVAFCNSGTEAVMAALRIARTISRRSKIVLFAGSYHGSFDGVLVRKAETADGLAQPMAPGVVASLISDALILDYGDPASLVIIQEHVHELAAVLVEPVQSRRPDLQPGEFLHQLRHLTQEAGIALIFDETITGFRIHQGGAQAWFKVRADIVTYGKIVGGGMPIGVIAGKARYMDALDGGMWCYGDASYPAQEQTFFAGTFNKHPLSMAAAHALLNQLQEQGPAIQEQLNQRTAQLAGRLNAYFEQCQLPIRVVHFGSLFRFNFSREIKYPELFFYDLLTRGIYTWEGRTCFLSTAHTLEDLDRVVHAVQETVYELQQAGFLPGRSRNEVMALPLSMEKTLNQDAPLSGQFPMTEAQKELWFLSHLSRDAASAYNETALLRLRGELEVEALRRALQELLIRHEALRISLDSDGERCFVSPSSEISLPIHDFSQKSALEREEQITQWLHQEQARPFDLTHSPLLRAHLLKKAETDYLLAFTAHHSIADGWSLNILLTELGQLYSAQVQGETPRLAAPGKFSEFVRWQTEQLQSDTGREASHYWREQFADMVPVLNLPTDFPRPAHKTFRGDCALLTLDKSLVDSLKRLSARYQCTLFVTLLSGFNLLLHRLAAQNDLVVGIPSAGQVLMGKKNLVGHCIHFLPVRSHLTETMSLREYLSMTKNGVLDAYDHQSYSFNQLVKELQIPYNAGRTPLVEVMFNLDQSLPSLVFPHLEIELLSHPVHFAKFDLSFNLTEVDGALECTCNYKSDLFTAQTIHGWLDQFQALLVSILADPEQRVGHVSFLQSPESQQARSVWNSTRMSGKEQRCIHEVFADQVEAGPEQLAFIFEEQRLTYGELNRRANQLAHYLIKQGIGPEARVAICCERSLEMVVGILAVLKAGGVFVPFDPAYPPDRLQFMLADADVAFILTQQRLVGRLSQERNRLLCLDMVSEKLDQESTENPESRVIAENLAYVIYTSGSTGRPKGVLGTHRATLNRFAWMWQNYPFATDEMCCQKTSLNFVDAIWEMLGPLLKGCTNIILSETVCRDIGQIVIHLGREHVTRIVLVPSLLSALLESYTDLARRLPDLKLWICSGEELGVELVKRFRKQLPGRTLLNLYGSAEVAADVTYCDTTALGLAPACIPIGKPITNTRIYILDAHLQAVLPGTLGEGEIYCSGEGVARGYLADPALTAERFLPDPFSPEPGARMYRTGDRGRYRTDGNIEYLGRIDRQVKIRGQRVHLGEIEQALLRHPAIKECSVLMREDAPGEERLVAYVVPRKSIQTRAPASRRTMQFSLFYFADDNVLSTEEKYRLYLEGAKFADANQFSAIWTPERHFHEIAGLYPNPSVLSAALAMVTDRVHLRAGSVVLPLHHPLRVAEEWAVVDNLSQGRVGLSFTSGWVPNDFAFFPEHYANKRQVLFQGIEEVQKLWRGEAIAARDGKGNDITVRVFPRPIQAELPIWLTCPEDPRMFEKAGELGVNVLTALLDQTIDELAPKIALYRQAFVRAHTLPGQVTLMLHTFLGHELETVLKRVRGPFIQYMKTHLGLIKTVIKSEHTDVDLNAKGAVDALAAFAFERYAHTASLIGTPETCLPIIQRLQEIGVDEIACLIDFGMPVDEVLESLHALNQLREQIAGDSTASADMSTVVTAQELRPFLRRWLPEFMLPSVFVELDALPRLPSGKVHRQELPAPRADMSSPAQPLVPENAAPPLEQELAELWRELLPKKQPAPQDNFFEVGGHSLLAMQLVTRVQARFGVELEVQRFFDSPTFATMIRLIEEALLIENLTEADELLDQLEDMDESEAQKLLATDQVLNEATYDI